MKENLIQKNGTVTSEKLILCGKEYVSVEEEKQISTFMTFCLKYVLINTLPHFSV